MGIEEIDAIVFDMGGTLYDTPREIVLMVRFILKHLELDEFKDLTAKEILKVTKAVDKIFDIRLVEENVDSYWLPSFDDAVEYDVLVLEKLGVDGDLHDMSTRAHQAWYVEYEKTKPKFLEDCRNVLETLRDNGYKLGIASNRRNDPIPHLEEPGILELFDVVEYSCVPGYRKPSPFMLIQAASKLGVNPQRCVYIGDKVHHDVGAAQNAGFLPILIVWCNPSEKEKASDELLIIDHIDELLEQF